MAIDSELLEWGAIAFSEHKRQEQQKKNTLHFIKIESWKIIHGESVKNSVIFFPIQNIPSGVIFAAKNISGDRTFYFNAEKKW